jgi:pimeloyl-ACP methyl ester carboxylesterase
MTLTFRRISAAAALLAVFGLGYPANLAAQDQPVVFIHGLNSSGSTWDSAAPYVSERLSVATAQPSQSWWRTYEEQGAELQWNWGIWLPSSTIAIGHSNGGVVAREWSKYRPLDAIVTLGTPHQGAPFVSHIYDWLNFNNAGIWYDVNLVSAFSSPHNTHLFWILNSLLADPLNWARWFHGYVSYQSLAVMGLHLALPVLEEMKSPSPYNQQLNSGANLSREASFVGRRIGLVDVPRNFYYGGPLRLLVPPEYADDAAFALHAAATALYVYGAYVQASADTADPYGVVDANDKASWMMTLGQWLNDVDVVWCSLVSSPGPISYSACQPNDSIVPMSSQSYPGADQNVLFEGVAHTFETSYSSDALVYVLHTMLGVPERWAPEPEPPPYEPPPDPPSAPPDHPHGGDILEPAEHLYPDQARVSNNRRFTLLYQTDGNLVIYRDGWEPIWASGTEGTIPGQALMSRDGNFIILDVDGNCIWASNTGGNDGAYLDMQDDGNLVVYDVYLQPLWASNTAGY